MAQVLWLTVGLLLYHFEDWTDKALFYDGRHDLVFSVLRSTAHDPAQTATLLRSLDDHFRVRDPLIEEEPDLVTSLLVWRAGSLVYSPSHMAHPLAPSSLGEVKAMQTARGAGGQLCKADPQSGYVVCFTVEGPHHFVRAMGGTLHDYLQVLFMMALMSGPFMMPIFWWALRPVKRLSRQVVARTSEQLDPIDLHQYPAELRPMVTALNRWMSELKTARLRERLFLANAAHELRTPLTAIQVNAEQLQRQQSPEQQRQLAPLLSGCRRMTRVVEQLMRLVRHESEVTAQSPPQAVDLARVLEQRLAELYVLAERKSVSLELQSTDGVVVWAPPESMESLVDNIVGNAIKYAPMGGAVLVRVSQRDRVALLDVEDNGGGIAEADRDRAFQPFTRLGNVERESGAGLGLAIAKSVALAQGGLIELHRSQRMGGLHVHIELSMDLHRPADTP
jgi:two-component system sensor histidine kinase QseC